MYGINYENAASPADYENWYGMSEAAKLIDKKGMGRTKLFKFLREKGCLRPDNEPYQQYVDQGYLKYVVKEVTNSYGKFLFMQTVTLVSTKGIEFIKRLINKEEEISE